MALKSGGPVYRKSEDASLRIVGVNSETDSSSASENDPVLPFLMTHIDAEAGGTPSVRAWLESRVDLSH